jgi:hypothetical protein
MGWNVTERQSHRVWFLPERLADPVRVLREDLRDPSGLAWIHSLSLLIADKMNHRIMADDDGFRSLTTHDVSDQMLARGPRGYLWVLDLAERAIIGLSETVDGIWAVEDRVTLPDAYGVRSVCGAGMVWGQAPRYVGFETTSLVNCMTEREEHGLSSR